MKQLLLFVLLCLLPHSLHAATIVAKSCSRADVQAVIDSAPTNTAIQIPAGTCAWSQQLVITKAIDLEGMGIGNTIIRDAMTISNQAKQSALILWTCESGGIQRLNGIEFQDGGTRPATENNGIFQIACINTMNTRLRVDHNKFNHLNGVGLKTQNAVGLVDHNDWQASNNSAFIFVYDPDWGVALGSDNFGNHSWNLPVLWGGPDFLFIEDNTFTRDAGTFSVCIDSSDGGRAVFRHNTAIHCYVESHGTESGNRHRGGRAFEVYENSFDMSGLKAYFGDLRSGSGLYYNNSMINAAPAANIAAVKLDNQRTFVNFNNGGYGGSDGFSNSYGGRWDVPDSQNPIGGPYAESATTSPCPTSAGTCTVTVADAGWTVNQWVGLALVNNDCTPEIQSRTGHNNCFALVKSSTADTVTYYTPSDPNFGLPLEFHAGDHLSFNRVLQTIDQIGTGGGALISSAGTWSITNPPIPPTGWNNQDVFPSYQWNNTGNGLPLSFTKGITCSTCIEGVHFINGPLSGYVPYTYPHPMTNQ